MLQTFSAVLLIGAVSAWGFPSRSHHVEHKPVVTTKSYAYSTSSHDDCTCEDDHDDHHVSYGGLGSFGHGSFGHGSKGLGSHSYGGRSGYAHSKPSYGFGHQKRVYVESEPKHSKSHGYGRSSSYHHEEPAYETIHIIEKPVAHHGHAYGGYGSHGLGMSHGKNIGFGGHGGYGHDSGLSMSSKHYAGQSLLGGVQNKLSGFGTKKFSGVRGIGPSRLGLGSSVGGLSGSSLGEGFTVPGGNYGRGGYGFGQGHGANYLQAHTNVS